MSNVLNRRDIKSILKRPNARHGSLMQHACYRALESDPRCLRLVSTYPTPAPANITREQFEARGPWFEFVLVPEVAAILERIDRWLAKAVEDNEPWTREMGPGGRIKHLSHIKTLEQALARLEKDEREARKRASARKERDDGNNPAEVQVACRFCDGSFAVQLKTPSALAWEGTQMRHCLGNYRYVARLLQRRAQYFSIRDARGRPHVTIEVRGGHIVECQGRANSNPFLSYGAKIEELAEAMRWRWARLDQARQPELLEQFGIDRLVVEGDLTLSADMLPLARTLYVTGSMTAVALNRLTALPSVLLVGGNLILRRCVSLRFMPRRLRVDGDVIVERCGALRHLAGHFSAGGSVELSDCPLVDIDPLRTVIGGALDVRRCPKAETSLGGRALSARASLVRQASAAA